MKKLHTLMFAVAGCLAIVSCSDDDSNNTPTPTPQNLSGSYQLTSMNAPTAQDYDDDGDNSTNLVLEGGCYNDSWISFHSDGTYEQSIRKTTTASGGLTLDCSTEVTSGTYTRNGNTVVTQASGSASVTTYTYNSITGTLSGNNSNGSYSAWNATTSLWANLTGNLQFTYTKYSDNENDNGASADTDGPNDDDNNANFWLLGHFSLSSLIVATAQNLDNDGDSSTNLTTESNCYAQSDITFGANGTYEEHTVTSVLSGVGGLSLTCNTETTYGTWTRNGDNITTTRTSSGSGSINATYAFNSTTRTLTRSNNNGSYPSFNILTSLYTMVNGAVSYTYTRSEQ